MKYGYTLLPNGRRTANSVAGGGSGSQRSGREPRPQHLSID
nr:MAG TPA: hypothetical protein [Caudoviricetes sp.]